VVTDDGQIGPFSDSGGCRKGVRVVAPREGFRRNTSHDKRVSLVAPHEEFKPHGVNWARSGSKRRCEKRMTMFRANRQLGNYPETAFEEVRE
jgi:hypothetical protein